MIDIDAIRARNESVKDVQSRVVQPDRQTVQMVIDIDTLLDEVEWLQAIIGYWRAVR